MSQKQWGASMGGPIARNRTFYFSNVEQRVLDQTGLTTITDQNVAVINARLRSSGYPGSPVSTGSYPNPIDTVNFLGKLDHQFSSRQNFTVRYSLYDVVSQNSRGAGALNAPIGVRGARQSRSVDGAEQHVDAVVEDGQRNALSGVAWRLEGAAKRSDRARRQPLRASQASGPRREVLTRVSTRCIRW